MRRAFLLVAVFAGMAWLTSGCSRVAGDRPPEIRYGTDACAECLMIIAEPRFAAAAANAQGEMLKFDDIGCLRMQAGEAGDAFAHFWVHDQGTEAWMDGHQAVFMQSAQWMTPMGHGVIACADLSKARDVAAKAQGRIIAWAELKREMERNIDQNIGGNTRE